MYGFTWFYLLEHFDEACTKMAVQLNSNLHKQACQRKHHYVSERRNSNDKKSIAVQTAERGSSEKS